ncbi:MAG: oligosaccharide flippase family protein, partial [Acidimicrobiales bacterium]|nr:oligosaccharide flippase family protein [Acidimicrobiales bacterium]
MSEGFRPTKLLHGSAWILVGLAIQSVLGFVFWFVASRVASSDAVGNASALYTAVQFINYASGLGLTVALARFAVDRSSDADSLLGWSVLATIVSSFVGGSLYLLVSNSEATDLVSGSVL